MWADQEKSSDEAVLDLLRQQESISVSELALEMEVTATAVRQRLRRLMAHGYIARYAEKAGRGRPSHRYRLTAEGRRKTGTNLPDFAVAAWEEISQIEDQGMRRALLTKIAERLVRRLTEHVHGHSQEEKIESLVQFFEQRRITLQVDREGELPILTTLSCPYPELADEERTICSIERGMFEQVLGGEIRQHVCRLDGGNCCSFELTAVAAE